MFYLERFRHSHTRFPLAIMTKFSSKSKAKDDIILDDDLSVESETEEVYKDPDLGSGDDGSQKSKSSGTGTDLEDDIVPGTSMVYVPEARCRAIYHGMGAKYTQNPYICMKEMPCQGKAGGLGHKNVILKRGGRGKAGYYQGAYHHGNVFAALGDTLLTKSETETLLQTSRIADRAHANAITSLLGGASNLSKPPDVPAFTPSPVAPIDSLDPTGVPVKVPGVTNPPVSAPNVVPNLASGGAGGQAELLQVMMNLCTTMKDMGKTQKATNAALISSMNEVKRSTLGNTLSGILKTPSGQDPTPRHFNHQVSLDKGTDTSPSERNTSSSSEDYHQAKPKRKTTSIYKGSDLKESPKPLFAVARGKGGAISVGLYREHYDKLSFLVKGFKKGRIKEVNSAKEGVKYINSYFKDKGLTRPRWLEKRQEHYPSLKHVKRHLGETYLSSSDSSSASDSPSESSSFSDSSQDFASTKRHHKKSTSSRVKQSTIILQAQREHIGVDPSMGKDNELFGVELKNVHALEEGLGISGIGKTTLRLFLEQMEDMTAYPRHSSTNTTEGLGELVEGLSNLRNQEQERRGGVTDTNWKNKHRNVLASITNSKDLNEVICFIQEEQHSILENCAGNMASILISSRVDNDSAIEAVATSLAYRISRDTLNFYFNLLNHVAGVSSTVGWARSKDMIIHHGNKLGQIRNKYRSRLQMIGKMYIYLRDGQSKNWTSLKLQSAQIDHLNTLVAGGTPASGGGGGKVNDYAPCAWCKTKLHGGGKPNCPWKDIPTAQAKTKAKLALVQIANPDVVAATVQG